MRIWQCTCVILALSAAVVARADDDAWPLYQKAAATIRLGDKAGVMAPAASDTGNEPFSAAWDRQEKAAYEHNAAALDDVHRAASIQEARWPVIKKKNDVVLGYLSELRNVANEVADASLYDHIHGNDVLAMQRIGDLLHVPELLDKPKDELLIQGLVSVGLRAITMSRMQMIATGLRIQRDGGNDPNAVSVSEVKNMIRRLFSTNTDPTPIVNELVKHEKNLNPDARLPEESVSKAALTYRRIRMEQNLMAMSLACHLFYFDKSRWPTSLDEVQGYLPAAPVDAWGPMGYVLIRGGTPDGKDRPLVYSRCDGDGNKLAYPTREPQYSFYTNSYLGVAKNAHSPGQFRDVTLWTPVKPLPPEKLHPLK
jgi:hypothetical protein